MDILWVWGEAFLRWLHIIAGIAWIGTSFYFIQLDYSLKRREGLPEGASGEAWQVHGGGFYNMVKYLVAPARLPKELTWFKWEAYTTWLSGFALVIAVYYFHASLYLIDPAVLDISPATGIAISVAGLILGWVIYDALCRSPVGNNETVLAAVGFVFLVVLAYLFSRVLSARGAFMQMGALIGTIMVANVAMVIIPGQRKVVADLMAGRAPDPIHGQRGKQRSTAQQLPDPARHLRDDLQPLPAGLRHALELGDPGAGHRHGRRHPPLLQHAPPGPAEPVVDLGCGDGLRGCRHLAVDPGARRAGAPARKESGGASRCYIRPGRGHRRRAAAACATPPSRCGSASSARPRAWCSTRRRASPRTRARSRSVLHGAAPCPLPTSPT